MPNIQPDSMASIPNKYLLRMNNVLCKVNFLRRDRKNQDQMIPSQPVKLHLIRVVLLQLYLWPSRMIAIFKRSIFLRLTLTLRRCFNEDEGRAPNPERNFQHFCRGRTIPGPSACQAKHNRGTQWQSATPSCSMLHSVNVFGWLCHQKLNKHVLTSSDSRDRTSGQVVPFVPFAGVHA